MSNKSPEHINNVMNEIIPKTEIPPAIEEANRLLKIKKNQMFIEDESFIGDPYSLLGRVLEVRSKNGKCDEDPKNGYTEFSAFPIPGVTVNENSKIKQPLKTKSFIVDNKLSLKVGFLSFLNAELDNQSVFSVIVFDQAVGLLNIHDSNYLTGLRMWMQQNEDIINDPEVCYLFVVTGMVQKNIIRKKYKMLDAKAKGGAYGLSVGGSMYTSTEDYSLDMRFGLSCQRIPIPNKTEILKSPIVSLANKNVKVADIDSYMTMKKSGIKGLPFIQPEIKSVFMEKLLLPSESEIDYLNKVEYKNK